MSYAPPKPAYRNLQAFAFDPSLAMKIDTAPTNAVTLPCVWEQLEPGPVGEYLEVIDYDPASGVFYPPVDLEHPHLLASDGLSPSEGNPQFHQQMVYAVAMQTIRHFERALGRRALWSPLRGAGGKKTARHFVRRLRIYPHALRQANAFYSPERKALLFGYFNAPMNSDGGHLPGGMVYSCLSYDIIAHEMTHALLDGLHPRFIEPTNLDVLAFHEAFADIVAMFQHFSHPEVLKQQVAATRGDLQRQNLLGQLAQQFGEAIGERGALRDFIGHRNETTGEWKPHEPTPADLEQADEPHDRGAILVAAIFEAFLTIYRTRTQDLLRIASGGSGILKEGSLDSDLVNRLANEASKAARHVLEMCIRALDYVPPVDVTFGDYLRALVTADHEHVADDRYGYRLAIIDAFRKRGIYPEEIRTLGVESVLWKTARSAYFDDLARLSVKTAIEQKKISQRWRQDADRKILYQRMCSGAKGIHDWLHETEIGENLLQEIGVTLSDDAPKSIPRSRHTRRPALEVHSVRPARRVGADGDIVQDLVIELTQRRNGYFDPERQKQVDKTGKGPPPDFIFRGGCTLLVDVDGNIRYCIRKNILNNRRLDRTREFVGGKLGAGLRATYFGNPLFQRNPFALLHCTH
jgi:hypothetical protein